MATDVVMPQMGESIAEGTIVRWIKKVGDNVDRDEPLFEISTDKVDAEIPSPAAGVVSEIRVQEGETVPVNSVVAVIGSASATTARPAASSDRAGDAKTPEAPPPTRAAALPQADGVSSPARPAARDPAPAYRPKGGHDEEAHAKAAVPGTLEAAIRERSSPLVRKIAKEHNVDISRIRGTGIAGRVTKDDILGYLGQAASATPASSAASARQAAGPAPGAPVPAAPQFKPGATDQVERMSVMRKRIAEHMILSRRTSAHVHSVFEMNFSRLAEIRQARKADFEHAGGKLTYISFIIKAAVDALRAVPIVNASVDGDTIVYHKDVNIGIAVALDWGLIVPVIKNADEKNLLGLSRAVADLANRARNKQLKPEEVSGGSFTITNPGVFGALFGMPIINQPQVAILGVGHVEKRPVVIDDAIAIRPMAYLTLGYDHRVIDGAVADEFMSILKRSLENWDPNAF
ncbi:MAG: 2-oxoglutarate dehydrogenase, E2 component, dihydrolipoamide succinyltransferase [Acidobacteria bacterium]|nr:MAG: 2-oxoglutarate dehydrogenase, E2 component, dihydrolipoamide succinyltransferase [Acidobacteriota bacterium]